MSTHKEYIDQLLKDKLDVLNSYRDNFFVPTAKEKDRSIIEDSIADLYAFSRKERPVYLWCNSPWQGVTATLMLELMLSGDDEWRSKIEDSLTDLLWYRSYQTVFEQVMQNVDRPIERAKGTSLLTKTLRTDLLFRDLLMRCDQTMRDQIDYVTFSKLRNLLQSRSEELFANFEQPWTAMRRPGHQIQLHLHTLSKNARRAVRMPIFRGDWRRPALDAHEEDPEPGTLESDLLLQLPHSMILPIARKLNLSPADSTHDSCLRALSIYFSKVLSSAISASQWGFLYESFLPIYAFPVDFITGHFYKAKLARAIKSWQKLIQINIPHILFENCCILIEDPLAMKTDERNRLHCVDGPAIKYSDGFELYSWHGITVPSWMILQPESITIDYIERETNAELRRVLIQRFGEARYIEESGAVLIDENSWGSLYRKELVDDEPLCMLKVINATLEADGTAKHYYLRVPPTMESAKEAVAWTFGMNADDYNPQAQS